MDKDNSGTVTVEELVTAFKHEEWDALFAVLGINVTDTVAFFKELDVDGNQTLDVGEFVMGCMRVAGAAKTVDMAALRHDSRRMVRDLGKHASDTDSRLKTIEGKLAMLGYDPSGVMLKYQGPGLTPYGSTSSIGSEVEAEIEQEPQARQQTRRSQHVRWALDACELTFPEL